MKIAFVPSELSIHIDAKIGTLALGRGTVNVPLPCWCHATIHLVSEPDEPSARCSYEQMVYYGRKITHVR